MTDPAMKIGAMTRSTSKELAAASQNTAADLSALPLAVPQQHGNLHIRYPQESLKRQEEGKSEFLLRVGLDGKIEDLEVLHSSGFPRLDEAAIKALRESTFVPAKVNGVAVASRQRLIVNFELDANP